MSEEDNKPEGAEPKAGVEGGEASDGAELSTVASAEGKREAPAADPEREAKLKAAAEARAARAAAKAAVETSPEPAEGKREAPAADPEREAKLKAAAEARAARAAAKAAAEASAESPEGGAEPPPKEPSPRQPDLDLTVRLLTEALGAEAVLEASLNELNSDMPTIVLESRFWPEAARLLKEHNDLNFHYLRNVSGVDYETHLEVVYYLLNLQSKRDAAIKLRTDRDTPSIPSAAPVWSTANWNEREIYDLLGVEFPGHPDLRRIMMPDDWVGHPLRKDYEPLDSEV
ncbi:NADH-quinone oxidoreductase subunit C [Paenibacillus sp. GCM10027627]|uniref:NADH-quinone oxidoreductase subunit C n=1 Tax=unclassified Paenibacillus TaxID=185978 RepID=UPI0036256A88